MLKLLTFAIALLAALAGGCAATNLVVTEKRPA
jgi:hypothetical protein